MRVTIKGKGDFELTTQDFLGSGGEGDIFVKSDTAFKIYHDPSKVIATSKFQELSCITDSNVIRPLDILCNQKGTPIGYTMRYIKDTYLLCQSFTKAFRDRNHVTPGMVLGLVRHMQSTVKSIHNKNILIVDLNEMNFLISKDFKEIFFIDVDSYQTRSFPATVLMESIRDRHAKRDSQGNMIFNEGTDWFAFAITSFQMFIGIHPFKGKHPKLADIDDRMSANVSVLDPAVMFPRGACQPFSIIPQEYMAWYKAVFAGQRIAPPGNVTGAVVIVQQVTHISGTKNFEIVEVFTLPESIISHVNVAGMRATLTTSGIYLNGKRIYGVAPGETHIAVTPKMSHIISGSIINGQLSLHDATAGKALQLNLNAQGMTSYGSRLYFKNGNKIYEIDFYEGNAFVASASHVANVHEMSSKFYDGVVIQNMFGKTYAVFFPQSKQSREVHISEVIGQVVAAKFQNNILMVVAIDTKGKYNRYIFRFDADYQTYDCRIAKDIVFTGLNFTVLDNGICCMMNEDEQVELFRNIKGDAVLKVIDDDHINGDCRILNEGTTVMFAKGTGLYTMTMKK